MSYETTSESRAKKLEGIFTDTSDILESESHECIEYFNKILLNDLYKNLPNVTCWIAGGSIRDYILRGKINDIDLYFPSMEEFIKVRNYIKWISGSRFPLFENKNCAKYQYTPKISSDLELIISPELDIKEIALDLIKIHSISPKTCIANFDFTICSAAIINNKLYYHRDFFLDIERKKLKSINPNPETLLQRIQKFSQMGFNLHREELSLLTKKFIKTDA